MLLIVFWCFIVFNVCLCELLLVYFFLCATVFFVSSSGFLPRNEYLLNGNVACTELSYSRLMQTFLYHSIPFHLNVAFAVMVFSFHVYCLCRQHNIANWRWMALFLIRISTPLLNALSDTRKKRRKKKTFHLCMVKLYGCVVQRWCK